MREQSTPAGTASPPDLAFTVEKVEAVRFAAVPTLRFAVRVLAEGARVRCLALNTQIRIAAARRPYDAETRERLGELFGAPEHWNRTTQDMLWARTASQVPEFAGTTVAEIDVACTYDFEVAVAKYFHSLADGEVPLSFLFSGTVFYLDGDALQAARIPWHAEAGFTMPVRVWKDVMEHYFPRSAWLRLDRDAFDRLYAYKVRHTLAGWDDVVAALLAGDRNGGR